MEPFGFLILTGGKSSRMGVPKQGLLWNGKTFLEQMVAKAQTIGAQEILLAGCEPPAGICAQGVSDLYPGAGPLSGICSGLYAAHCEQNLVVSVDLPQLPSALLEQLIRALQPEQDCLLLRHGLYTEPLISVWRKRTATMLEFFLKNHRYSVSRAADQLKAGYFSYTGAPEEIESCNTPQAYQRLRAHFGA